MATQVDIYNKALGRIGSRINVASITETSAECDVCNLYYDEARQETLKAYPWEFATKHVALVADSALQTTYDALGQPEWTYVYDQPSDHVRSLYLVPASGDPHLLGEPINYETFGGHIYTDEEDAELKYIADITDVTTWPVEFIRAMSWRLAADIVAQLTGDLQRQSLLMQAFDQEIRRLQRLDAQEDRRPTGTRSNPFIDARS